MAAESETNSLTMKLLALANYCEGPKAQEIKNVIAQLPMAAYKERTSADSEIARLRQENSNLKQRLFLEALAVHQPSRPSTPRSSWKERESARTAPSTNSSVTSRHDSSYGSFYPPPPPLPKELFPETWQPQAKRMKTEAPSPTRKRPRPICTGCFQVAGACDGRSVCSVCRTRGYRCEYNECWDGNYCADMKCTRLHPEQWSGNEEPRRVVKGKGRSS
ncbi:hypothetical protein M409DRAFT_53413 [Zasmidium cellare ATCC 36951]|uniref:Uncharacterized protein n=1 Tax=Zasmidium cellare ATCC 36951 TaxID=1080233 RepID=A0A6A6CLS8_ZASCE|nr:uncharacterized protein M409DRAFT_53413 [Zasmidium cellare ATCC 36951]KAF2168095.1 hypothetical protein M409DRAFT_53413 [Zasmidium cellare ATCC 36951]